MSGFFDIAGKVVAESNIKISPFDRGFLLGDGCFEVILVKNGVPIFLKDHLERLFSALERLEIKTLWTLEELSVRCQKLIEQTKLQTAYLRITVTRGIGGGFANLENFEPNLYLYLKPLADLNHLCSSVKLGICTQPYTRREAKIKSTDYQESIANLIRVRKAGFDDLLWVNSSEEIVEASAANIFFLKKEKGCIILDTPSLDCGILPGVTRLNLIRVCKKLSIQVNEKRILQRDLSSYSACFLSSSIKLIVEVSLIDQKSFKMSSDFSQKLLLSLLS